MRIVRALHANRMLLCLGLLGLIGLASGCDDDKNKQPAAPPTTQAQQDAERAAREAAYGKGAIPGKPVNK